MARTSLGKRLLLLATTLVLALVVADLGFRWWGPALEFKEPFVLTPTGLRVPLAEIYHFSVNDGHIATDGTGPRGRLQPGLKMRGGYDRPRWSYFDADGCIAIEYSELGFRDEALTVQKPAGEYRALALGDSFTLGLGVRQQDSWPEVLEDLLRAQRGAPVQVINAGMACGKGARSAAQYAPWLESDGLLFAPDLVLLGFCLNDMADAVPMVAFQVPRVEHVLGGCSAILDLLHNSSLLRAAAARPVDVTAIVRNDPQHMWAAVQDGMRRMHATLLAKQIPFVVAVLPMMSQLDGDYPYAELHRMVDEFCAAEHIACVDLLPLFRGRRAEDLWAHPTDQHPNDVGHRLFAEGIFAFLRQQNLLPGK